MYTCSYTAVKTCEYIIRVTQGGISKVADAHTTFSCTCNLEAQLCTSCGHQLQLQSLYKPANMCSLLLQCSQNFYLTDQFVCLCVGMYTECLSTHSTSNCGSTAGTIKWLSELCIHSMCYLHFLSWSWLVVYYFSFVHVWYARSELASLAYSL